MKVSMVSQISIDGKITLGKGNSSKMLFELLTEQDMRYIHGIRGQVDGIIVGMNTIRTDNPTLTCRYDMGSDPVRIIPSKSMQVPKDSNILTDDTKTIFITIGSSPNAEIIEQIVKIPNKSVIVCGEDEINFHKAFKILEEKFDIHSIMLEGGGTINWSLIEEDLIDEIIVMQLPIIIGGGENTSLVDGNGFTDLKSISKFKFSGMEIRDNISILKYVKVHEKKIA